MTTSERISKPEAGWNRASGNRQRALTQSWAPGTASFWVTWVTIVLLQAIFWNGQTSPLALSVYVSLVWTAPIVSSLRGVAGGVWTIRRMRPPLPDPGRLENASLVICVPTIGRDDTLPALRRSIESFLELLPSHVARFRVDVVVEEESPAIETVRSIADESPDVRLVVVPAAYATPNATRFKARANQYANELRAANNEARDDLWVLHMDDDTSIGEDTAREVVRFISANTSGGGSTCHLAQGVLTYPREYSPNWVTWLADSVRPACDVSLFPIATGRGHPHAGLHGELLLVRASVEATIGWDFGPQTTVEDAEFALRFADLHPGQSEWIPCRSYGASPASIGDLLKQRERWFGGLIRLAFRGPLPLRHRVLMTYNVTVWAMAPLAYPGLPLFAAYCIGADAVAPVTSVLLPIWATNMAFGVWLYWEGYKINVVSSARPSARWERFVALGLLPVLAFLECLAIARALFGLLWSREIDFVVIAKPL